MEGLGGIHFKTVDWGTAISDPGYFHLPGDSHKFRDWKKTGHGLVNYLKDNIRAWLLQGDGTWTRVKPKEGEAIYNAQQNLLEHFVNG